MLKSVSVLCGAVLAAASLGVQAADQVLLSDQFSGPALSSHWDQGNWVMARTQFGNPVSFGSESGTDFVRLKLDTYNPNQPGQSMLGTHLYTQQRFPLGTGLELKARVRAVNVSPGLVASAFFFEYDQVNGGQDEIDIELLTSQPSNTVLATSFNDWVASHGYSDPAHFSTELVSRADFDNTGWNEYKIRWYADRVEWYLNDEMIRSITTPVPTTDLQVMANFWAPGAEWVEAYSAELTPVNKSSKNQSYAYDIDYIVLTQLDGSVPPPPAELQPLQTQRVVSVDWGGGYCEDVTVSNPNAVDVDWLADLTFSDNLTSSWDADVAVLNAQTLRAQGSTANNMLAANSSHTFGFCADRPIVDLTDQMIEVTRSVTEDWGSGHCENVNIKNISSQTGRWQVDISEPGSMTTSWNAVASQQGSNLHFSGVDWNDTLSPGAATDIGFCIQN